jgi:hypothetical protein
MKDWAEEFESRDINNLTFINDAYAEKTCLSKTEIVVRAIT